MYISVLFFFLAPTSILLPSISFYHWTAYKDNHPPGYQDALFPINSYLYPGCHRYNSSPNSG